MNTQQKLNEFNRTWQDTFERMLNNHETVEDDELPLYFNQLAKTLNTSVDAAHDIWYANQRSWLKPGMIDAIIEMAKNPTNYSFHPNFASGDFEWDEKNQQFLPGL